MCRARHPLTTNKSQQCSAHSSRHHHPYNPLSLSSHAHPPLCSSKPTANHPLCLPKLVLSLHTLPSLLAIPISSPYTPPSLLTKAHLVILHPLCSPSPSCKATLDPPPSANFSPHTLPSLLANEYLHSVLVSRPVFLCYGKGGQGKREGSRFGCQVKTSPQSAMCDVTSPTSRLTNKGNFGHRLSCASSVMAGLVFRVPSIPTYALRPVIESSC